MPFIKKMTDKERFYKYVEAIPFHECWEWSGHKAHGYGHFKIGSRTKKNIRMIKSHRFSYELNIGPIPNGKMVCHKCDNRSCVRPDHLFIGTASDNMKDMIKKNRGNKAKGALAGQAKLSEGEVLKIRELYISFSQRDLARKYKVSKNTIAQIVNSITWKHI